MNRFAYQSPASLAGAVGLLAAGARPLAGGTDLLALMKNEVIAPDLLIDLQRVGELHGITESDEGLRIGAATAVADLLAWRGLWTNYPVLAQAAQMVGWPEIRTMGSVGGNLCQRPRCWYYRHPLGARCLKRGGDHCYPTQGRADGAFAIYAGGPCWAVHPSDLAPALIALDASVTIASQQGTRSVPLSDLYRSDDVLRETVLQPDELLVSLFVPRPASGTRSVFLKSKRRPSHDFSRASVALAARINDGRWNAVRLVLGSVALVPWRLHAVEDMLEGQAPAPLLAAQAARETVREAKPLVSASGTSNRAKVWLVEALVYRALARIAS